MKFENRLLPHSRKRICWIVLIAGLAGFAALMAAVMACGQTSFDQAALQFFVSMRQDGLSTLMEGITYLGCWEAITILCLLLMLNDRTFLPYGVPLAIAAATTSLFRLGIKAVVQRPRPPEALRMVSEHSYSFPSGHAITSFAVYGLLAVLLISTQVRLTRAQKAAPPEAGEAEPSERDKNNPFYTALHEKAELKKKHRRYRIAGAVVCLFLTFAIGLSRLYLGVHWATDVLAGWCFGAADIAAILIVRDALRRKRRAGS
ncbi:MAG: phosphatase PAP2 family protein [Anaerovoracaceae bacterium]|jgi:membrane-associated phospholipid phosphatase